MRPRLVEYFRRAAFDLQLQQIERSQVDGRLAALTQLVEETYDGSFCRGIHSGKWLVQEIERSVLNKCPCQEDSLLLTA